MCSCNFFQTKSAESDEKMIKLQEDNALLNAKVKEVRKLPLNYEPQCDKTYFLTSAQNEDSNQPAYAQSNRCPHEETLHTWLSKMRPAKIQIRLRKCAV